MTKWNGLPVIQIKLQRNISSSSSCRERGNVSPASAMLNTIGLLAWEFLSDSPFPSSHLAIGLLSVKFIHANHGICFFYLFFLKSNSGHHAC